MAIILWDLSLETARQADLIYEREEMIIAAASVGLPNDWWLEREIMQSSRVIIGFDLQSLSILFIV